jgi:hypothetical protein
MVILGPLLMFGGLLLVVAITDRLPVRSRAEEHELAELWALEDQAREEWDREDREREEGSDSWAFDVRAMGLD